ncbi:bifunctional glutamate N-acetyltransferase/amino-acid acetyltransferase ArgJ [Alienimonas californiensis]|uniref:Arginine biosynthesis bifunctional protein ArgJ n=1 Tax=Alienimonas californiensis TaxID=2527989 RepID=A0A517PF67_9PLAN|nr:bifunctional glutamate N-acetyltransferase/amino-acid acetyltransferase ArgJ [Alienimonas californiensis]QDT18023.1 Arginine biosynthesis bifunctional protein ArgJ [Alienimonas californiensis]
MPAESVPLPAGFSAAGLHCGVKSDPAKRDLALFVSDRPATAAGVFTQNVVVGAPVQVSRERVPTDAARAVVINSGCSNVSTGERGLADARAMTAAVAAALACDEEAVTVCSTGVIGQFLNMNAIRSGLPQVVAGLGDAPDDLRAAAEGMRTTDTFPKLSTRTVGPVRVSGAGKGAAMIAPNMATMLAVVLTDAALAPADADRLLRAAVDRSFNRISVDGHQSTSDTVLLLANGAAGPCDEHAFAAALNDVCEELATDIIRDAEGATHFVTVDVTGLPSDEAATTIARSVADSPLVKTAIHGADPNWGRIISAAGYAGVPFDPGRFDLDVNGHAVCRGGVPTDFDEAIVSEAIRSNRDCTLTLNFHDGPGACRFWTCDLTAEYVRLNADYTT